MRFAALLLLLAALFIGCNDDTTGLVRAAEPASALSDEAFLTPAESDQGCYLSPSDIAERARSRRAAGLQPPITEAMVRSLQKRIAPPEPYSDPWGPYRPQAPTAHQVWFATPAIVEIQSNAAIGFNEASKVPAAALTAPDALNVAADGGLITRPAADHGAAQSREMLAFTATWCPPCRRMHPIIDAMQADGAPICEVDADERKDLVKQYGVKSLPCYVMLIDGKEVARIVGGTTRKRLQTIIEMEVIEAPKVSAEACGAKGGDGSGGKCGIVFPTLQVLRYIRLMNRRR